MKEKKIWLILAVIAAVVIVAWLWMNETPVNVYEDTENCVSFENPAQWEFLDTLSGKSFATTFEYINGTTEKPDSVEAEGALLYSVGENPEGLPLKDLYDESYRYYLEKIEGDGFVLGPSCRKIDIANWEEMQIDGYRAYILDWRGYPESGENDRQLIADKNFIVNVLAVKTGLTDEELIENTLQNVIDTIKLK